MRWANKLSLRLRSLFRRHDLEQELDDELRFHHEQQIAENVAAGMSPEEARFAARRKIGGVAQIKEECRDERRVYLIENCSRDLRYALGLLSRNPSFTATGDEQFFRSHPGDPACGVIALSIPKVKCNGVRKDLSVDLPRISNGRDTSKCG